MADARAGAHAPMNQLQHQAKKPAAKPPRAVSAPTPAALPPIIGERVRAARWAANLTQVELAGTTFSKSYISAVERGKMTPSLQALHILAERLSVTISSFFGEEVFVEEMPEPAIEVAEVPEQDGGQVALLHDAEQLLHEGRYEEALAFFEQAGQPERTNQARELYAQFLADQGRYQEAYEQMRRALQGKA